MNLRNYFDVFGLIPAGLAVSMEEIEDKTTQTD